MPATTSRRDAAADDRPHPKKAVEFVDLHCHCLPGLDDGPETIEESIALCRALVADGVTTVIATPHQLGLYDGRNDAATIRKECHLLQSELLRQEIPLIVKPGADIRIDERILKMLDGDQVLTLADRRLHLLLEIPHETFIDPRPLVKMLVKRGFQPIITHPERHSYVRSRLNLVSGWVDEGAACQITAGSLLGDFGDSARTAAWQIIAAGAAQIIAGDAHDVRRRPPRMAAAHAAIEHRLGRAVAQRLCVDNPLHVLAGRRCPTRSTPNAAGNA